MQIVGADPKALGDAGPEDVDERVGVLDQLQQNRPARSRFDVQRDRPLAAPDGVVDGQRTVDRPRHVDAHDVGTEVAEQHAAEGAGTKAAHRHDPHAAQRSGHCCLLFTRRSLDHFCRRAAASSVAWLST